MLDPSPAYHAAIAAQVRANCSRFRLPELSAQHPALLNASINVDVPEMNATGLLGPAATHAEHAEYR